MAKDIADELEAEGSTLSKRAARYISIKRNTETNLRHELRRMCEKSLGRESSETAAGEQKP